MDKFAEGFNYSDLKPASQDEFLRETRLEITRLVWEALASGSTAFAYYISQRLSLESSFWLLDELEARFRGHISISYDAVAVRQPGLVECLDGVKVPYDRHEFDRSVVYRISVIHLTFRGAEEVVNE